MKIIEKRTVETSVVVGYRCDRCDQEADNPTDWATVSHHHSEWGNDSCDSHETFDLCSPKCYLEQLRSSVDSLEGYSRTGNVDDKPVGFVAALLAYLESPEGPGFSAGARSMRLNYEP